MITPREIDCPSCGRPNEYSLGSCRRCGLEREEFDKLGRNEGPLVAAESPMDVGPADLPDFLTYLVSTA